MDDNELENEREKRDHELKLAKLQRETNGWDSFWTMCGDNIIFVVIIVIVLAAAIVSITTGQKFDW